eukprot:2648799-Rhodomonas_salina.1
MKAFVESGGSMPCRRIMMGDPVACLRERLREPEAGGGREAQAGTSGRPGQSRWQPETRS